MRTFPRLPALLITTLMTASTFAQSGAPGWLEEQLYSSGKINTVVAVVAVILLGIGLWLFRMDRRIKDMEGRIKK
jgi:CcmD family protein